ncbi:MAG: tRNA 2-selenouridine(34) synthase MnmH [Bacteroidota bacterium]|nr:tRNA 2-selenouridine(34) synthase MnmH [Bacteroidota bacterium]
MAITRIPIEAFLELAAHYPVLDVRSPGEFSHAQIPGAISLPLFTDEERKVVGTAYKQESRQKAIKLGLAFFGKKMVQMVEEVEALFEKDSTKKESKKNKEGDPPGNPTVLVHCWRGGMRSAGVAWLLDLYGYKVYTLAGGYKAYRNWVLQQFEKEYPIHILGGYTGSGKTEVLHALAKSKQTMIDLEGLANHKGSAFGNLGLPPQPSQEMFENLLAAELYRIMEKRKQEAEDAGKELTKDILSKCIWLEDESQRIGEVNIPAVLFRHMRTKPIFFLNIPFEERLKYIVLHYGKFEKAQLINAIMRIKKRLGGLETKTAINAILEDNIEDCFAVLLRYYDKFYLKSLQNREDFSSLFNKLDLPAVSDKDTAKSLLAFVAEARING